MSGHMNNNEFRIYSTRDGLGGMFPSPLFIKSLGSEKDAVLHIMSNHDHHAVAPNGDRLCFDGVGVVREPNMEAL